MVRKNTINLFKRSGYSMEIGDDDVSCFNFRSNMLAAILQYRN